MMTIRQDEGHLMWFIDIKTPEKNYHTHPEKLEFLALKWSITGRFRDYLYSAPHFVVYTNNNPLTYVLITGKVKTTGQRYCGRGGKHSVTEKQHFSWHHCSQPECYQVTSLSHGKSLSLDDIRVSQEILIAASSSMKPITLPTGQPWKQSHLRSGSYWDRGADCIKIMMGSSIGELMAEISAFSRKSTETRYLENSIKRWDIRGQKELWD